METPSWRPLPVAASQGLPALLVSTTFTRDSYAIHVTDLAHIWSETLDRKAIYRRSLDQDTSIDPTDSNQNMQQFLSRIRSALEPSHPDHLASRATITAKPSRETGEDGLSLKITCDIPDLEPLKWPVYLQKAPPSRLATELVLPLVQTSLAHQRQVSSLLDIIHQKDAVMSKLLDKLESTGTRLEHIFTVLSAKQKATRKAAEEKVNGLAAFREEEWKVQVDSEPEPKGVADLTEAVFGEGLGYDAGMNLAASPALDEWWKSMQKEVSIDRPAKDGGKEPTPEKPADEDDDDDFQVQATPPHLSTPRKGRAPKQDDSTEDEQPPPSPEPAKAKPKTRIGAIRAKKRTPSPAPAPEASETESEADEGPKEASPAAASSPPPPASSPPPPSPPRKTPKKTSLGRIGGSKAPARSKTPETASSGQPPPRRLGQIGRKPAATTPEPSEEDGPRGRRRNGEAHEAPAPRETSEERANRKREELRVELEKKAAAGPAKKRRRF